MKDAETLVLMCPIGTKDLLMEAAPEIYYQTDHYKDWPALLIRLRAISDAELGHRIETAWRMHAGKRLLKLWDERNKPGDDERSIAVDVSPMS